jgi:glutathione synthase/RimK-type ligase-like ATP-grasp enzyme
MPHHRSGVAGGIRPLTVSLASCNRHRDEDRARHSWARRPPAEGALVLFVPGGSFEQVATFLGVLHALRELGVTVWNDARAIERCVDKSTTTFFLQRAGIPTPWTWTGSRREEACAVIEAKLAEGQKLVRKPLFGAQGEGLRLISSTVDLAPEEEVNGVYYLQEFVPLPTARTVTGGFSSPPARSSPL